MSRPGTVIAGLGPAIRRAVAMACLLAAAACTELPTRPAQVPVAALPPAADGVLADTAAAITARLDAGDSGLLLLPDNQDAMDWRLALIDSATTSLDIQYFIWNADACGDLLMQRVLAAADRGVGVRILVDDLYQSSQTGATVQDHNYAALSAHPNIDLRIFNPGKFRDGTVGIAGNFLGSFDDFNRRMHNKLMLADGLFGVVGGRNIADEYCGLNATYNFLDLDLLFAGPAVDQAGASFDTYWNDEHAFPAAAMAPAEAADFEALKTTLAENLAMQADLLVRYPVVRQDWQAKLAALPAQMVAGHAVHVQDPPEAAPDDALRLYNLLAADDTDQVSRILIATAYLIPRPGMLEEIRAYTDAGIEVVLLTNSLASNDHTAAASQYNKFRKDFLAAGARLYEFRHQPGPDARALADAPPVTGGFIGLHMKAGVSDDGQCFVGSLNLDPRAIDINTENGIAMKAPALCEQVVDFIDDLTAPEHAWAVGLGDDGRLTWTGAEGTTSKEPARASVQRFDEFLFRLLPLQKQL